MGAKVSRFTPANTVPEVNVLPTGIASLDFASGIGGFPCGSQIEIFGKASVGKSLLACYMAAEAQKRGHAVAYIDLEGKTLDPVWISKTSKVDLSTLMKHTPYSPGMEAVETLEDAIDEDFKLIFMDSLGCMVDDTEKDITKMRVGGISKIVTHMVTRLNPKIREKDCVVVYLNHSKDDMNSFGNPGQTSEIAPGGRSKENMCFMRINLRRGSSDGFTDGKNNYIGFRVNATFIKNKSGVPKKKAGWNLWNEPDPKFAIQGIDLFQDTIDMCVNYGIIQRGGKWFTHEIFGNKPIQGVGSVMNFLSENPEKVEVLQDQLRKYTKELYMKGRTSGIL